MKNIESVFLGVSKQVQCSFYHDALSILVKTKPKLLIPCCGTMKLASVAIAAGYKPENIELSDISFFSKVLGYYYAGKPVPDYPGVPDGLPEEVKAGWIITLFKIAQLRDEVVYEAQYKHHYRENIAQHAGAVGALLAKNKAALSGVTYVERDLRDIISTPAADSVVIIHAPAYSRGYEKMFKVEAGAEQSGVAQLDFKKEFGDLFDESRRNPASFIWSYYGKDLKPFEKGEVFFAEEVGKDKYEYFLVTKPEELAESRMAKQLAHNAINGKDDPQKLKELYDLIGDVEAKIEAAIEEIDLKVKFETAGFQNITLPIDFEVVNIVFLPHQRKKFEEVVEVLTAECGSDILVADRPTFDAFKVAARKVAKSENIRNITTILGRMCELTLDALEIKKANEKKAKDGAQNQVNA